MVLSKKEQRQALLVVAIVFGFYHFSSEWSKLLIPFLQWDATPSMDASQLNIINAANNGFMLLGTFIAGHFLDTAGVKFVALATTFLTGCYFMACSQAGTFLSFLILSPLRVAFQLPQVCEVFLSSVTDEKDRMRAIMRLVIPYGIGAVLGPWIGSNLVEELNLRQSQMIAGVVVILAGTPLILFAWPEKDSPSTRRMHVFHLSDYKDLLKNPSLRTTLLLRFLLDGPFQTYDYLSRQYIITEYLTQAVDLGHLFAVIGATTIFVNLFVVGWLQRLFRPRQLLQLALVFLTVNYALIGLAENYYQIVILMPMQVVGMSIAYAEISAQITKPFERGQYGKAVGLGQATQLLAATLTPLIGGIFIHEYDFDMWCGLAAFVSFITAVLLYFAGDYMNVGPAYLPSEIEKKHAH